MGKRERGKGRGRENDGGEEREKVVRREIEKRVIGGRRESHTSLSLACNSSSNSILSEEGCI